jgi:hypothetical protein
MPGKRSFISMRKWMRAAISDAFAALATFISDKRQRRNTPQEKDLLPNFYIYSIESSVLAVPCEVQISG